MRTIAFAAAAVVLATACTQAQNGPTTSFDGLAGSRNVDTDGNVEMNGAAISLSGRVGGWVEMNGASVDVDARIGGDLEINGGAIELDGSVGGATTINGGAIDVEGSFQGPVEINGGAIDLTGDFGEGFSIRMGALEFAGEARGAVEILGSGRSRNWRGQERGDRSEVEINGGLPAGALICAHEVKFGSQARFAGQITVIADSEPSYATGVDSASVTYQAREGERCDD